MLKKITLLAMAIAALVAFAAPSMASADFWYTGANKVGGAGAKDTVHFTGTLSSTKSGLKISCNATANVWLWNERDTGIGDVQSLSLTEDPVDTGGCTVAVKVANPDVYADLMGCHVEATTGHFPWFIEVQSGTLMNIETVHFTYHFSGCNHIGIPDGASITIAGAVTGQFVSRVTGENQEGCIVFEKAGHISETKIDGELCSTEPLHLTAG